MLAEASDPLTADQLKAEIGVSRETIQKFELYLKLLKKCLKLCLFKRSFKVFKNGKRSAFFLKNFKALAAFLTPWVMIVSHAFSHYFSPD